MGVPYDMGRNCGMTSYIGRIDSTKGRDVTSIYLGRGLEILSCENEIYKNGKDNNVPDKYCCSNGSLSNLLQYYNMTKDII